MDYIFGQSTWPLLLGNLLLSPLKFFFSLAFFSFDGQPTQPLGKENTGSPRSSVALNLFRLVDFIHDQLTQLLRNENTLFIFLLAFAFFFAFFIVAHIYRRRSIKNQPPNGQFCSLASERGPRSGSSNTTLGRDRQDGPAREDASEILKNEMLSSYQNIARRRYAVKSHPHAPPSETKNTNKRLYSLGKKYDNKSSKHSTNKISFKHGSRAIGEEWVENNIRWKIGSNGELLRRDLVRRANLPSNFEHPERLMRPEIYIEKWLTMEEYDAALASHILMGQETWKQQFLRAKTKLESIRQKAPSFINLVCYLTNWMANYKFGFSGSLYNDLVHLVGDPIPTLADEEGHAKLDKIASQPTETTHSPSSPPFVSSTEAGKPLHPPTSATSPFSFRQATVQPTLYFATPSESAPSNTSPYVVVESEGETFQPTMFPKYLSGTLIAPETNVKASALESDTRPHSPGYAFNTASVALGPLRPIFEFRGSNSATASTAVHSKQRRRAKVSSKRLFTSRANRPSSYPSIQKEPDLTGFARISSNAPNDPTSASFSNDSLGSSASISAIKTNAVPNSLAADLGLLSTSSDAANQFIPSEHSSPLAYASNTATVTATPSHISPALSGSASATAVDALATELEDLFSLSTSDVTGPSQPILSGSSTSVAEPTMVDDTLATGYDASEFSSTLLGLSQPNFDLSVGTSAAEFMTVDDTLIAGYDASQFLSTLSGTSQPTFDLGAGTSAAEFTMAEFEALQFLSTLLGPSQPAFDLNAGIHAAEFMMTDEMLQFLSTLSDPVGPSQPTFDSSAGASTAEFTTVDNTLATGYDVSQFLSTLSGPSQPIFDLGPGTTAAESTTADDLLVAGYEMLQFLSTLPDPTDPSQPPFDLSAGIPAAGFTTTNNTLAVGYDVSQPIFDLGAGTSAAESTAAADELAAELDDELTAELKALLSPALLSPSAPSGGANQFTPSKNGSKQRRRAKASSNQRRSNKPLSYPSIQGEPNLTVFAGVSSDSPNDPSGSDSQPSMVTFIPFLPGDGAVDISGASATGSYPFSFSSNALVSAGNVNAPQPSTSVLGTIAGTSNSFNDAGTSIGANKQAEAVLSTQMLQPLFDLGMTGGQLSSMDTAAYEGFVPVLGMGTSSSAVDTMQSTSSSLFNALGSQHVSTPGSTNILRTTNTGSESTDASGTRSENVGSQLTSKSSLDNGLGY